MKYTKKQCKEDMILLWGELARTGGRFKYETACRISREFGEKIASLRHDCPCCEIAWGVLQSTCADCPIKNWKYGFCNVCRIGEYFAWEEAETKLERQYYANKILILSHMIRVEE